jgi:hypothetical protein
MRTVSLTSRALWTVALSAWSCGTLSFATGAARTAVVVARAVSSAFAAFGLARARGLLALLLAARLAGGARISPTEAWHLVGVRVRPFLLVFFDERLRLCPAGHLMGSELGVVERVADSPFAKLVQQRAHVAGSSKLHLLHDDSEIR